MKKILFLLLALLLPIAAHAQTAAYSGFCDQGATPATVSGLNSTNRLQGIIPYCTVTVYLDGVSQVSSASYSSGGTITGTVGQTCNATFIGGSSDGTASIALTGANVITGGTAFAIAPPGIGQYPTNPTTATLSSGTATCSGTATVVTVLSPIKATIFKDSSNTAQTNPYQTLANGQILFYAQEGQGYDIVKSGGIPPLTYTTPLTVTDWLVPIGGGGSVNSVTATLPLSSTGGSNPNISIPQANSTGNGFLFSGDWNTFNNKQDLLTNPVTGVGQMNQLAWFPNAGPSSILSGIDANQAIYEGLYCSGSSGNGAAYACNAENSPNTANIIFFKPDATSVANATLSVNGGSNLPILPPLTSGQWTILSAPIELILANGSLRAPNFYWQQVNVSPTLDSTVSSCVNTGSSTVLVCTSSNPGFTLVAGTEIAVVTNITSGTAPTLNVNGTGPLPMTNQAHVAIPSGYVVAGAGSTYGGPYLFTYDSSGTGYWVASGSPPVTPIIFGGTGCTTAPCAALGLSQVQVNESATRFNTDLTDNASLITPPAGEQLLQIETGSSNSVGVVAPISLNVLPTVFDMYYYAPADAPGAGTVLHEQKAGLYNCTFGAGSHAPVWDANLASLDFIPSAASPDPFATCPYQMLAGAQSIMLFYSSLVPNFADGGNQVQNFLSDPNGNGISVTPSRYGQVQVETTSTVSGVVASSDDRLLGNSEYDWSCVSGQNVLGVNGHGSQGALFNVAACPPWNASSGSDYIGDLAQLPGNGFNAALKLYAIAIAHSRPATQLEKAQAFTYFTNQLAQAGALGFADKYPPYLDIHTGDSIQFNAGNGGGFTSSIAFDAAQMEPENDQWYNWGIGGKTLCAVVTSIPQNEGAVMPSFPSENKVVRNNAGINDFFAGSTDSSVYGCAQNYASTVHSIATDSLVLMGTILPSDEMTIVFGHTDAARQAYNADLISGAKAGTFNGDGVFDFGGDFEMSTQAIPNVYLSTNPALALSGCTWTSSVATCTIASGSFNGYGCGPGWTYAIAGVSVPGYNGNQGITTCTGTTITYPLGSSPGGSGTGGTATPLANGTWYVDGVHPSAKANMELAAEYSFEKTSAQGRATKPRGLPYYIDFQAVSAANVASPSLSQTVKLRELFPGQQVCWVSVNVTTAFAGTGVTGLHMTIGDSGGTTSQYMSSVSLFSIGTTLAPPSGFASANGTVQMTFTATGANLSQLNAGVMTVTPTLVGPGGTCPGAAGATGGSGPSGVGKTFSLLGDSRLIVSGPQSSTLGSCEVSAASYDTITASTVTGSGPFTLNATLPGTNTHTVGDWVTLKGFTGGYTALNGQNVQMLPTPTSTAFTALVAGVAAGTSGTGADDCTYAFPKQFMNQPGISGGTLVHLEQGGLSAATVAASPATYIPTVTGASQYLLIELGSQDFAGPGGTVSNVEGYLTTISTYAHNNGYTAVLLGTLLPTQSSVYNYDSLQDERLVSDWIMANSKGSANHAGVSYYDYPINFAAMARDPYDPNWWQVPNVAPCNPGVCIDDHPTDALNAVNAAIAAQAVSAYTQNIPAVPDSTNNSFNMIMDQTGSGAGFTVRAVNYSSGSPAVGFYPGLGPDWDGSPDSVYTQGPLMAMYPIGAGYASVLINKNGSLCSSPSTAGLPNNPCDVFLFRSAVNTWCMSSSAASVMSNICDGTLKVANLTVSGTLTATVPPPANVAFQMYYNNTFIANGIGSNDFQPSNPAGVAVQVEGSAGTLIPSFVQGLAQAASSTLTLTGVPAGGSEYVYCNADTGFTGPPTDGGSGSFSLLASATDGTQLYELFGKFNVVGGSTVTITQASGFGCGAWNQWGAFSEANTPTSGVVDGTPTMTAFLQSSGGVLPLTTAAVTTTQANDTLIAGIIPRYTSITTPLTPLTSEISSTSGSMADMPTGAPGAYIANWTYNYPGQGYAFAIALKGATAGQTGDLIQVCGSTHTGHGSCGPDGDGTLLSAANSKGQIQLPVTAGMPSNTPLDGEGALAWNSALGCFAAYHSGAWICPGPSLIGTTGSIGGSLLTAGTCASGTASVTGAVVGHTVGVSSSDGTLPNALATLSAAVTSTGTVTVQVCAIAAVTPSSKTYNVTTY